MNDRTKPTLPCPPPDFGLRSALERLDAAQDELRAARAAVRYAMRAIEIQSTPAGTRVGFLGCDD